MYGESIAAITLDLSDLDRSMSRSLTNLEGLYLVKELR